VVFLRESFRGFFDISNEVSAVDAEVEFDILED
jgi:hypothetical protein